MTIWQTLPKISNIYYFLRNLIISNNKFCPAVQCATSKIPIVNIVVNTPPPYRYDNIYVLFSKMYCNFFLMNMFPECAFSIHFFLVFKYFPSTNDLQTTNVPRITCCQMSVLPNNCVV